LTGDPLSKAFFAGQEWDNELFQDFAERAALQRPTPSAYSFLPRRGGGAHMGFYARTDTILH